MSHAVDGDATHPEVIRSGTVTKDKRARSTLQSIHGGQNTRTAIENLRREAEKNPHVLFDQPEVVVKNGVAAPPQTITLANPAACSLAIGAAVQIVATHFEHVPFGAKDLPIQPCPISESDVEEMFRESFRLHAPQARDVLLLHFGSARRHGSLPLNLNPQLGSFDDQ